MPELAAHLLGLSQEAVAGVANDSLALIDLLAPWVPEVNELRALITFPKVRGAPTVSSDARLMEHVPGRKQAQIQAFVHHMGPARHPVLEWCAGKGHLGRLVAHRHGQQVISLEVQPDLVAEGQQQARRFGLPQTFVCEDVLSPSAAKHLGGRHAMALHACGDLHLHLLRAVVAVRSPAMDLAPCCYYRTAQKDYSPLCDDADLDLTRDELHLAVTETVTSGPRDQRLSDRVRAWKLAFLEWRATQGISRANTFKPVPSAWMDRGFAAWMGALCQREGVLPPSEEVCAKFEREGWRRQGEVQRLELVRLAFRRPLEVWLVLDQALFLECHGYRVQVMEFCDRRETPRNLLISARI